MGLCELPDPYKQLCVCACFSCVCGVSPGGSARSALISLIHPQHIERKMEGWEGGKVLGGILVSSCLLLLLLLPHVGSSSRQPNPPKPCWEAGNWLQHGWPCH